MDLTQKNPFKDNEFDYIHSFCVFEHILHPFEMLQQCTKILKPGGKHFIRANLYRSPIASHLYNCINFPFPHLLFDHQVISQFAREQGTSKSRIYDSSQINKLTYSQYKEYFRMLNLELVNESLIIRNLDFEFYKRFEEKLGVYPIFDLELDMFNVTLTRTSADFIPRKNIIFKYFTIKKDDMHYMHNPIEFNLEAEGLPEMKYALEIYLNSKRIYSTNFSSENNKVLYIPTLPGEYSAIAIAKDGSGFSKKYKSESFMVLEHEDN